MTSRHAATSACDSNASGVNLIGHITGNMGLGVAARNTLSILQARQRPCAAIDIDPGLGRQGADPTFADLLLSPPVAPHRVNLWQLNPPEVLALRLQQPAWLDMEQHANAIVPFWELPLLPVVPGWRETVAAMDLVLAPSRFILDAVAASLPAVPAIHYPQTVFLPDGVRASRATFGLPHDTTLFFLSLDVTSDLDRKNPQAVLAAFRQAFPEDANVGLVIKLSHARTGLSWADPAPLLAEIAATPRTFVIDGQLPYVDVLSLAASCDAYVSLHRSEGLGLNLLEAMLLGKPVIATGWSGNMDFMSRADSCLVGYDLVPVRGRHPAYQPEAIGPGQVWAEPRVSDAADWMRRLATDPILRSEIGGCAGRSALARQADVLRGEVFTVLDQLATNAADLGAVFARRNNWQRLSGLARSLPQGRGWPRFLRRLLGARPT